MTRRSLTVLLAGGLLITVAAGCATGKPSREFADSPLAEKVVASYDFGVSVPVAGDLLLDAEARVGGSFSAAYMFTENFGIQGLLGGMSATEEEEDQVFGGQFGNFRQETSVFAVTVGPRVALPIPIGAGEGGPSLEPFVEGGFGGYFTRIYVAFPRGVPRTGPNYGDTSDTDATHDFGLNGGGGIILRVSDTMYIGASARFHVAFFRPEGGERFLSKKSAAIADGVFADSGGGRSDELGFLVIGGMISFRF